MRLIALYPILFESHQYKVGDVLPAHNEEMVKAWLEAGTAKWEKDEQQDNALEETDEIKIPGQENESYTGVPEAGKGNNDQEPTKEKNKEEKQSIGRSAKNAARKKGDK